MAFDKDLLCDLNHLDFSDFSSVEVVLILNIPENEDYINHLNLKVKVIRNATPFGFGKNNNIAFKSTNSDYFSILNPDLRIPHSFQFSKLIDIEPNGAIAPKVLNSNGIVEDSCRKYPSVMNIFKRHILKVKRPNYLVDNNKNIDVDWVAGMFILFNSLNYSKLNGFNEKYFMYLEDADICRRFNQNGLKVVYTTEQYVIHDARRQSLKSFSHFKWHLKSMFLFLFGNNK
ncbi:glycosyltransferase family 2 protein [Vibrio parahaemolyticus]|nr:glycosyltransferase family 2 protein [Vibrio parahaemolyticus]